MEPGQLLSYGLTPDTYVWRQGWQQWCKAKFVDELQPLFGGQYNGGYANPGMGANPYNPYTNPAGATQYWQPGTAYNEAPDMRPPMSPTYLPWALIVTLICCMPVGIVAIIYSSLVESRYTSGNYVGSQRASETTKTWCIVGAVLGAIYYLFGLLYMFGSIIHF